MLDFNIPCQLPLVMMLFYTVFPCQLYVLIFSVLLLTVSVAKISISMSIKQLISQKLITTNIPHFKRWTAPASLVTLPSSEWRPLRPLQFRRAVNFSYALWMIWSSVIKQETQLMLTNPRDAKSVKVTKHGTIPHVRYVSY